MTTDMKWFQLALCTVTICVCFCSAQTYETAMLPKLGIDSGIGNFSLILLHHTAKELNGNVIISPIIVWSLMAALAESVSGRALNELLRTLHIREEDRHNTKLHYAELFKYLTVNTSTVSLERSSALFVDSSIMVEPSYIDLLRNFYWTDVHQVNLKNPGPATKLINNYVSHSTHGRIKEMVSEKDLIDTKLILTNAMYFKGKWNIPFNVSETSRQLFYNSYGQEIGEVDMMYGRAVYPYIYIDELESTIIELPYGKNKRYSMLVILPYSGVSPEKMFLNFQTVSLTELFLKLNQSLIFGEEVECWIPRFKISTDVSLVNSLKKMGIYEIFDPDHAEFPKLSKEKVYLSQVIQKAEIEVIEEGTTAAAVTLLEFKDRIMAPEFKANRPFVFLVVEKVTNMFVFAGVYSTVK